MNKNGNAALIFAIMLGITILFLALALAPVLVDFAQDARNTTSGDTLGMDCDNVSISNFDKAACLATDITPLYFIGGMIFIAGAVITARIIMG